ncbi:hypothetical protein RvY_14901 [Ramazzottius varieornatus]|uniref:Major facilitator superfamily (MFS) profile domain-containing protein n=1 Tax=Ramazzottius varieornatus TaxID=947166 RepID=A0A1D1VWK2_RAMVA|nr:hypothetical protein RvY_14901 [Ramazzottius varieornatus]
MSIPEGFSDPGTVVVVTALGENPLGGSVFEKQVIHEGDEQWQEDHQAILQRVDSETGSVRILDAVDLPTFYTSFRLAPLTIFISLAFGIIGPIHTELLKMRICEVKLNISEDICEHISDIQYKELANSVVRETAQFQLYSNLISSLPPIIFSLFVGSWSDAYGRKPPMVLSLVGMTASAIYISILANYRLHPAYLLVAPVLSSLTGGWTVLLMAMFSFVGDYTIDKNRGTNIALIDGILIVFGNAGSLLGGYVYKLFGMVMPFYLTIGCYVVALLHTAFFLHDRLRHTPGRTNRGYSKLFTLDNFLDNFRMLRRARVGNTRAHIALLLFCLLLITTVSIGDGNVLQLLVEFQPFNWSVTFYTVFSCVSGLLSAISMMAAMILFRQYLGMPDTLIGMLAVLSAILYYFGFGVAQVDWVLYVSVVAGLLRNIMIPCLRSLLSGLVDRGEIGKIMSFISSCQSVTPLFASVIFTSMFAATSSWWPGLCFVVGAFVLVPVLACLAYVDVARRQEIYVKDPSLLRPDSQQSD